MRGLRRRFNRGGFRARPRSRGVGARSFRGRINTRERRRNFNRNRDERRTRLRRRFRRYRTYNKFAEPKKDDAISGIITKDQILSKTRLHITNLHPSINNEELKVN